MNILIVQARLNSNRLPSKVLLKIGNKTIIEIIDLRLKKIKLIDKIIYAIPKSKNNLKLYNFLKKKKLNVFLGPEKNVLRRFLNVSKKYKAQNIVRITADCPFVDKNLIQKMMKFYLNNDYQYVSNTLNPTYPDGIDIEIFNSQSLNLAAKTCKKLIDKEHVTTFIKRNDKLKKYNYRYKRNFSQIRLTIDTDDDYRTIKIIFKKFNYNYLVNWETVANFYLKNIKIMKNSKLIRDYDSLTKTQKMWKRAKSIIPGGNSMISKNPSIFDEISWPGHFSKSKGCFIWDLDNKKYIDLSLMGVGTNILGYSNSEINKKVQEKIKNGNISTLNSHEEVILAEKLIDINSWADKVLFARTGAEANSIAIRLARMYSGKDKIAFCGYHGWNDWFLASSNKNSKEIQKNFLPYYSNEGIPKNLINSVMHFEYNNISSLENLLQKEKQIGTIKMEVIRNEKPKKNFLNQVRRLANKYNKVLIFDECTTGFRECLGGIYKKFDVEPDILILGKSLGNGYPITCVIGKEDIMNLKSKTFISSTFWTDRIGPAAALETLKVMERDKTWKTITNIGKKVTSKWVKLSKKHKISITTQGIPALTNFYFNDKKNHFRYRYYLINYLLKKRYLSSNIFYASISHNDNILKKYFSILDESFYSLNKLIMSEKFDWMFDDFKITKTFR